MPIHHFTSLFHSTTTSNNLSPKVRVEYSCGSVEYTTACSTLTIGYKYKVGTSLLKPSASGSEDLHLDKCEEIHKAKYALT